MNDASGLTISQTLMGFKLRLRASNRSDLTIKHYVDAAIHFEAWLTSEDLPTEVAAIGRSTIEAYLVSLADRGRAPVTVATIHKCLRQYFNYLLDDEEISRHPMAKVAAPFVPEKTVPVVDGKAVAAMLATCATNSFSDRRDAAVLRLMVDSGTRLAETFGLTLAAIDLEHGTVEVIGKGHKGQPRPRLVTIGHATAAALDRYLRARARHPWAAKTDRLWLGQRGPLGSDGIGRIVAERAKKAGLGHVHPHQLRHTWASAMKEANVQPDEIKALAGWSTDAMLQRYGRATVTRRAIASGRRHSLVDGLGRTG